MFPVNLGFKPTEWDVSGFSVEFSCTTAKPSPLRLSGWEMALVTHCFHRAVVQCSHTAPLRCPAHRFGWDSLPPHRDLQPLLLKRKTHGNRHNLIFTPTHSSIRLCSGLATLIQLDMVKWKLQDSRQGSLPENNGKRWLMEGLIHAWPCASCFSQIGFFDPYRYSSN